MTDSPPPRQLSIAEELTPASDGVPIVPSNWRELHATLPKRNVRGNIVLTDNGKPAMAIDARVLKALQRYSTPADAALALYKAQKYIADRVKSPNPLTTSQDIDKLCDAMEIPYSPQSSETQLLSSELCTIGADETDQAPQRRKRTRSRKSKSTQSAAAVIVSYGTYAGATGQRLSETGPSAIQLAAENG